MKLTLRFNQGGVQRSLDLLVTSLKDLDPILRRWGGFLRKEAKDKFQEEGPGWDPLSGATTEKLAHTRTSVITAKGQVRSSYKRQLRIQLRKQMRAGKVSDVAQAELERLYRGCSTRYSLEEGVAEHLRSKALQRLRTRLEKAEGKTAAQLRRGTKASKRHKILGKLASSLYATVRSKTLTVASRVPWAGVQNEGGTVGHGAELPARTFLELTDHNVSKLAEIAQEQILETAFGGGGRGKRGS